MIAGKIIGVLLICAVVLPPVTVGQQDPIVETREEKLKRGEALFHEASELVEQKTAQSLASAAAKFGEARVIFQRIGDKEREGFCLTWLAGVSSELGDTRGAIDYLKQALTIYKGLPDRPGEAEINYQIGRMSLEVGDATSAFEYFHAALKIYTAIGAKPDEIDILKVIGKAHLRRGEPDKALAFNEQALGLARSSKDKKREVEVLKNIGSIHFLGGEYQKAIGSFEALLALARTGADKATEAEAISLLSTAHEATGDVAATLKFLDQGLKLAREHGDKKAEVRVLNNTGRANLRLGSLDVVESLAEEARKISIAEGDKAGEGGAMLNLGIVRARRDENEKAIEILNKAVVLLDGVREFEGLAMARMVIGGIYMKLGDKKQALDASAKALGIANAGGYTEIEAESSNNVGAILLEMGDAPRALEYFRKALPLAKKLGLKDTEARIQLNVANALRISGKNPEAIENLKQAEGALDPATQIRTIVGRAGIYLDVGETEKAFGLYMEAMFKTIEGISKADKEQLAVYSDLFATILNNLGRIYAEMGALFSALDHYQRSLPMLRELKDKNREAITLTNIADIYAELGQKQKSVEFLDQALVLAKETGNRGHEATILNAYGTHFSALGDKQKAIEYYGRSLFLLKVVGDPRKEAITLANMLAAYDKVGRPRVAAFYGKLAVNRFQSLRSNIRAFDRQTQKTYLTKVEVTYRHLAELLIRERRLAEAQQLLNALKDQQNFDDETGGGEQLKSLSLTARETELAARFESAAGAVGRDDSSGKEALAAAEDLFVKTLRQIEDEMAGPAPVGNPSVDIQDVADMRAVLSQLEESTGRRAAAVYILAGRDTLSALVISPQATSSVSIPVKNSVIDAKAKTFWALLQSDRYDPTAASKELYEMVFKPIEEKLPHGTGSILWSLDGSLRYIPVAALYDGKEYLVERYNNINFTRAERERLTKPVSRRWTMTGLGTSNEHTVDLLGSVKRFGALPGVVQELTTLISQSARRGILDGDIFLNEKFTKTAMIDALKLKRPVVHIATHFSFSPGDETRSFLLMGDGTPYTLADMKKQKDLFAGVELLTLSACNTAAQQPDANGREIDAFFELAQRLGANSVLATLWPVADNSTPWLMREFYTLKRKKHQNKAEALRNAQIALLKGSAAASVSTVRTDPTHVNIIVEGETADNKPTSRAEKFVIAKKDAKPFVADPRRPFAHPFYWSPFVLIGNWR